jgi:hypothetical protein
MYGLENISSTRPAAVPPAHRRNPAGWRPDQIHASVVWGVLGTGHQHDWSRKWLAAPCGSPRFPESSAPFLYLS